MSKPRAYSYIRFSRPEQMRGDSLRRQVDAANKWAAENGVVIDESLVDQGVSAYRGLNKLKGALGRFLALVEQGEVPKGSFLIFESLDRFSRQAAREVLTEFLRLINAGITIVTLLDEQVYNAERLDKDNMALFGSLMIMQRAHEESRIKGQRLAAVWEKKRKEAADSATVISARIPGWLEVKTVEGKRRFEFKPGAEEIISRIFAETVRGYGRRQIAIRLKHAGHEPFRGGTKWQPSYIKKVLENRAVIGELQSYRRDADRIRVPVGDPIKGYYPAVVSEEVFLRANSAKESRAAARGPVGASGSVNVLRGISFCVCGRRMVRENKGPSPKGGVYLICSDATPRGNCANTRRWRLDMAEEKVLGRTSRINVAKLLAPAGQVDQGPTVADAQARVDNLNRRLVSIMDMVEQGVAAYRERAVDLSKQVEAAKADLAAMMKQRARLATEPSPDQRRRSIVELRAKLEAAGSDERAELRTRLAQEVRGAFTRVTFGSDRIELTYKGAVPFGAVMRAADVTVLVYTENPDEMFDLATMNLDAEELQEQDRKVAEFLRLSRLRREGIHKAPKRPRSRRGQAEAEAGETEPDAVPLAPL